MLPSIIKQCCHNYRMPDKRMSALLMRGRNILNIAFMYVGHVSTLILQLSNTVGSLCQFHKTFQYTSSYFFIFARDNQTCIWSRILIQIEAPTIHVYRMSSFLGLGYIQWVDIWLMYSPGHRLCKDAAKTVEAAK